MLPVDVPIDGVPGARLIEGLLSSDECEALIQAAEAIGLKPKLSRRSGPPIRNNARALYRPAEALTQELEQRLAPILARVDVRPIGDGWQLPADGRFVNSKWRINSYATGEAFLPHYDSGYDFGPGKRTLLSLIIYLNDDFVGGETTFFPGSTTRIPRSIRPKTGAALLFHHYGPLNPLHDTRPLTATGRKKYIVRTDIVYEDRDFTLQRLLFTAPPVVQKAVLLLGVPGAGKSTQLAMLHAQHGFAALNFGQCVRSLRGQSSPLAQALTAYRAELSAKGDAGPDAGPEPSKWLPEELSRRIFTENLPAQPADWLALDGYPRMRSQSLQLETSRWLLLSAIYLKVPEHAQQRRLHEREADDRPPLELAARMRDWERDTYPLIEHYRKRGLLDEIDASGDAAATALAIERVVAARVFALIFSFVPPAAQQLLADYTPSKVNLSKKHIVYRFSRSRAEEYSAVASPQGGTPAEESLQERYLKIIWAGDAPPPAPAPAEEAILAAVKQPGFPFATPQVVSSFSMGPAVSGVLSERVPGITLKEAFARRLLPEPELAVLWARALSRLHAFVPARPADFPTREPHQLLARAAQRLSTRALSARSFSAKYGVPGALDLEAELAELTTRFTADAFTQVRLNHGDPCAPNFIFSPRARDITGCVDLSGLGYVDIHWDLSIACWSLSHNTGCGGPALTAVFLTEYARCLREQHGLTAQVMPEKLALMYRLARFLL